MCLFVVVFLIKKILKISHQKVHLLLESVLNLTF